MNASVSVQIRIPLAEARIIRRAAKAKGLKLATYVREVAIKAAQHAAVEDAIVAGKIR